MSVNQLKNHFNKMFVNSFHSYSFCFVLMWMTTTNLIVSPAFSLTLDNNLMSFVVKKLVFGTNAINLTVMNVSTAPVLIKS